VGQSRHFAPQQTAPLFDHFVGNGEQGRRHGKAEHAGGLGVDDQFELARLHDWQFRRLRALEDALGIDAGLKLFRDEVRNGSFSSFRRIASHSRFDRETGHIAALR
jgi:hypothetical protein